MTTTTDAPPVDTTSTKADDGAEPELSTADDWATAVETSTFPLVTTGVSEPVPTSNTSSDTQTRFINTTYLACAENWMPLDYSVVSTPSIAILTAQHKERAKRSSSKTATTLSILYATLSLIAGLVLNIASWACAATSTALNRGLVSGDQWRSEDGRPLRPRHLSVITADNARRSAAMHNRVARSLYILAACSARLAGQVLNLASYTLARIAVTINDPARLFVATIPATIAGLALLAWLIAG